MRSLVETRHSPVGRKSEFLAFLDADWKEWLEQAPEVATWTGASGPHDRWTDDSADGIEARRRHLARSRERLQAIDPSEMTPAERVNHELYRDLLETAEAGLRFGDDPLPFRFGMPRNLLMPLNQMDGIHLTAPDTLDLQPRRTVLDYEAILRRLAALPVAIDQQISLMESGRTRGWTPPRVAIRGVPDQVHRLHPAEPHESALLQPFQEFPVGLGPAESGRLAAEARRLYEDRLAPSMSRLEEYLTGQYLPACRESVGASDLPEGTELYRFRVRWQTTTAETPDEVHEIGLREVRRLRGEMEHVIRETGFAGSFVEFLDFLRSDPRFFLPGAKELVDHYRVIAKRCDPELARLFGHLPRLPYGVVPMPEFKSASSPAAYYQPGAPEAGRAGYFNVNTHKVETRATWESEALALHEAVPGHHLQIALAQELSGLPDFRRHSGYTAFVEGWGLYAESLGEELGFYRDPYSKFGRLSFDMWRSVRLVVDTGMHALGWSRDRAIQFFRENTGTSDQDIGVEVDRYIVWPGQALAYKMGQLKIRELRTYAERALGDRFDVRSFHDRVLEEGALPLGELERRVRAWVDGCPRAEPAGRSTDIASSG